MSLYYTKPIFIKLKGDPQFNEKWVQERIIEDPTILRLGELLVKDVERMQPKAGRLDLLLYNPDTEERYEIELMLGSLDESHIIRTIEYWDNERKRYPQYEHKAVIIAEEITTRFLNVISLFNQNIPLIAIQMNALKIDDKIILNFTKVLDEIIPGEDDEEDFAGRVADREFWENKPSKTSLPILDKCLSILHEITPAIKANYKLGHIGLKENGRTNNFIVFFPKISFMRVRIRIPEDRNWREKLEETGIDLMPQKSRDRIAFRITLKELTEHYDLFKELFRDAYLAQQQKE